MLAIVENGKSRALCGSSLVKIEDWIDQHIKEGWKIVMILTGIVDLSEFPSVVYPEGREGESKTEVRDRVFARLGAPKSIVVVHVEKPT